MPRQCDGYERYWGLLGRPPGHINLAVSREARRPTPVEDETLTQKFYGGACQVASGKPLSRFESGYAYGSCGVEWTFLRR